MWLEPPAHQRRNINIVYIMMFIQCLSTENSGSSGSSGSSDIPVRRNYVSSFDMLCTVYK